MENLPHESPSTMAADNVMSWPNFQQPAPAMEEFNNASWANDFAGFSTVKRRAHRRSISDVSMAFVEEPTTARGPPEANAGGRGGGSVEMRLDDEAQLIMSMLSNELMNGSANSSSVDPAASSSSATAQKRRRTEEREEVESLKCFNDDVDDHGPPCSQYHQTPVGTEVAPPSPVSGNVEAFNDPKRVKRILANRQYAQRSRVRKLQYVSELERSMTRLQTEVSMLSPRVAYVDHQRMMLNVDNTALKSKIAALSHDKLFKDAHQEALKREIERLKQIYQQQSSMDTTTPTSDP